MDHVIHLKSLISGQTFRPDEIDYVDPAYGPDGIVDVQYDYDLIGRRISRESLRRNPDPTIWRYKPMMPVEPDAPAPPLSVGGTPLYATPRLASGLGLRHLWIKDDGRNPTASFKDRASAVAVVKAQERRAPIITTASTGNAAAALAGIAASIGQATVIFVPEKAPQAKIAQLLAFGATVMLVRGKYDDAFELCLKAADAYGWYNRNTGYNPYMTEGKKTCTLEICEQLNWEAPDRIFVSVGDGCIIGGLHKGLKDALALGWIDHMPKLMGVQAAGSNYLAEAWEKSEDVLTKPAIDDHTVADSISAGLPRDRLKAMAAVVETGGAYITVSDEAILAAIPAMARGSGVFGEPAGAAAYAGLVAAMEKRLVTADERIVVVNTGSGLKDVAGAMKGVEIARTQPYRVDTDLASVDAVVRELGL